MQLACESPPIPAMAFGPVVLIPPCLETTPDAVFKEIEEKGIYIPDTFMKKRLEGIEKGLLDKEGIKATSIGYKFLNDTINLFS